MLYKDIPKLQDSKVSWLCQKSKVVKLRMNFESQQKGGRSGRDSSDSAPGTGTRKLREIRQLTQIPRRDIWNYVHARDVQLHLSPRERRDFKNVHNKC